jgi:hypothetical protein
VRHATAVRTEGPHPFLPSDSLEDQDEYERIDVSVVNTAHHDENNGSRSSSSHSSSKGDDQIPPAQEESTNDDQEEELLFVDDNDFDLYDIDSDEMLEEDGLEENYFDAWSYHSDEEADIFDQLSDDDSHNDHTLNEEFDFLDENMREFDENNDIQNDNVDFLHETSDNLDTISEDAMLHFLNYYEREKDKQQMLPDHLVAAVELLSLLKSSRTSLNVYAKVVDWAFSCRFDLKARKLPTRKTVLQELDRRFHLSVVKPVYRQCILPSINLPIRVPVCPMMGVLFSLLTDPDLMKAENLNFVDPRDPSVVRDFTGTYSEVDTGAAYHTYLQKDTIANCPNAVVIPLIIFIDETTVDRAGRHSQTPIMMTLGCFKFHVRSSFKAWRIMGFVKNKATMAYTFNEVRTAVQQLVVHFTSGHPEFVPPKHRDWHAQLRTIFDDLYRIQQLNNGMKWRFCLDGVNNDKEYRLFFPIHFFVGDTMGHNLMCSLRGGNKSVAPCRFCPVRRSDLDKGMPATNLTSGELIRHKLDNQPRTLKEIGYYACRENILYRMEYCDSLGCNAAMCPDILHAVLLGWYTRAIQGFSRLKRISASQLDVFSPQYREHVESSLRIVGKSLAHQSDPDLPRTHFTNEYLPSTTGKKRKEDNHTGKKSAHEMRGVMLTILCFILLQEHKEALERKIGEDILAGYVLVFELTMLYEAWLNKDQFTEDELQLVDKFMPIFVRTFVRVIRRTEGHGMKLIKMHLPMHFTTMIRLYGRVKNIDTMAVEKHHKEKVKDPGRTTNFQADQFEMDTATKDWESGLLLRAENEICANLLDRNGGDSVLLRHVGIHSAKIEEDLVVAKRRTGSKTKFVYKGEDDSLEISFKNKRMENMWCSEVCEKNVIVDFLRRMKMSGVIYTQHNLGPMVKIRGDPFLGRHDWFQATTEKGTFLCHVLCFIETRELAGAAEEPMNDDEINEVHIDHVGAFGKFAVVHFVDVDVFSDGEPTKSLYGVGDFPYGYRIDGNCDLVRGWCKHTSSIYGGEWVHLAPRPSVALFNMENETIEPCVGLCDDSNTYHHSYIFLKAKKHWPDLFLSRVKALIDDEDYIQFAQESLSSGGEEESAEGSGNSDEQGSGGDEDSIEEDSVGHVQKRPRRRR